jgi:hypothetical protein
VRAMTWRTAVEMRIQQTKRHVFVRKGRPFNLVALDGLLVRRAMVVKAIGLREVVGWW